MKKLWHKISGLLSDNSGDENFNYIVIVMIAFVAVGIMIAGIIAALRSDFGPGMTKKITDVLD